MNQTFYSTNYFFRRFYGQKYRYTDARAATNMHYIGRMRKGSCRIVGRDTAISVPEGGVFYIPERLAYQSYWYGNEEIEFDSFGFRSFPEAAKNQYVLQVLPGSAQVHSLMDSIADQPQICSKTLSCFYQLLAMLLPEMTVRETLGHGEKILDRAVAYLSKCPRAAVAEVAQHCGISESGLYSLFRRYTGATPNTLRHKILAEQAIYLLQTTDLSIEQISSRLEFSSSSYFRKVLRAVTGKTPRQLRRDGKTI